MSAQLLAASYSRSSKDRHDASIDAQQRKFADLARADGNSIVAEFADSVESADDWDRPGFRDLLLALASRARTWSTLYIYDTARIAREDEFLRATFNHTCKIHGVTVRYAMLPEVGNPLVDMMVSRIAPVFDAIHSVTSREKGRAGMRENVRQGWRAGGRAPWGYKLEHVNTGAVREGIPVTKSRLVPADEAPAVAAYLKGRAADYSRSGLARKLDIRLSHSSLIGVEWNAITYAGATVWNVHNETVSKGYATGTKRRPRDQWLVQAGTHEALITQAEAETILRRLETSAHAHQRGRRRTNAVHLLTGLLRTFEGTSWYGDKGGRYYRLHSKGPGSSRSVPADAVDRTVLAKVNLDLRSPAFAENALQGTRRILGPSHGTEIAELHGKHKDLGRRISRFMDMAVELDSRAPVLRKIEEIERERAQIAGRIAALEERDRAAVAAAAITADDVLRLLGTMAEDLHSYDREGLKNYLGAMLDRVELDPQTLDCQIHYRISLPMRNKLASPREADVIPLVNSTTTKVA